MLRSIYLLLLLATGTLVLVCADEGIVSPPEEADTVMNEPTRSEVEFDAVEAVEATTIEQDSAAPSEDVHVILGEPELTKNEHQPHATVATDAAEPAEETESIEADATPAVNNEEKTDDERRLLRIEELMIKGDDCVLETGDYACAESVWLEAAKLGSGEAINLLGELEMYGWGREHNYLKAQNYFRQAAEYGSPDAQHNLGFMASLGLGMPKDPAMAVLNYYFAALGGSIHASMTMGYRHVYGIDVPKSCDAAASYYTTVAKEVMNALESNEAELALERAYLTDEESRSRPPTTDEDVIQYYQHTAESGDARAQLTMGQLHYYGLRGVEQDPEAAARYFRAAAAQNDPRAISSLAQMHVQGIGLEQDNETAFRYYSEAAAHGDDVAQNGLGNMYFHGTGCEQDYKQALRYFKASAQQGNMEAQYNLGAMYFAGVGVAKNHNTALQYFTHAAQQSHTRAIFTLAKMHLNGLGTVPNCDMGVQLMKTVAERGSWAAVLGQAHESFLDGDLQASLVIYAKAAEEGYEVAQVNSAYLLDEYSSLLDHSLDDPSQTRETIESFVDFAPVRTVRNTLVAVKPTLAADVAPDTPAVTSTGGHLAGDPDGDNEEEWELETQEEQGGSVDVSVGSDTQEAEEDEEEIENANEEVLMQVYPDYPEYGGVTELQGRQMALRHFSLSADQGNVDSMRMLGDYSYYGWVDSADYEAAAAHYLKASGLNNAHSMFNLGYMHEHGLGLPRDFFLAKRYYDLTLETSPEAFAPVYLALLKLKMHSFLAEWLYPDEDFTGSASSSHSDTETTTTTPAQDTADNTATANTAQDATERNEEVSLEHIMWALWDVFLALEDVLLIVACLTLGMLVFLRARVGA